MRLRAAFLLAFTVLLLDAARSRLVADPPPDNVSVVGWITPIPGNTNCPVATHDLRSCLSIPSFTYLVFEKANGSIKDHAWGKVGGFLDLNTCAPYTLIHVRRVGKTDIVPPPCE